MDEPLSSKHRARLLWLNLTVCVLSSTLCLVSVMLYHVTTLAASDQAGGSRDFYLTGKGSIRLTRGEQLNCTVMRAYKSRRHYTYRLLCNEELPSTPTAALPPYPLPPAPPAQITATAPPYPLPAQSDAPTVVITRIITALPLKSP